MGNNNEPGNLAMVPSDPSHSSFTFKPAKAIAIVCEGLRQDFKRHVPVELGVPRSIHLTHAAFADLGGDGIGTEGGAGLQRHQSVCYAQKSYFTG